MIGHYTATSGKEIAVASTWSAIVIQVDEAGQGRDDFSAVVVEGKTMRAANYASLGAIRLSDYSVMETLDDNGLYLVDLSGLDSVKLTFDGCSVYYNAI